MVAFGPGKDRKDRQRYFERQTKRRLRAEETKPDSGGVTDHGALTGLGDDDHTQYHNDTRAGTWLATAGATVKTAYEGQADTNAYTDAEKTKLAGLGGASNFTFVNSTPYTAANGELLAIDTTSTAITVDLPSGTTGDIVFIMPNDGDFFTNNVTVVPASGESFEGAAADETLLVDDNVQFYLQYTGSEWEVFGVTSVSNTVGGGGGGTPLLTPPVLADFTAFSGGSTPAGTAITQVTNGGLTVECTGSASSQGYGAVKSLGSTWTVTQKISDLSFSNNTFRIQGMLLADTSTNECMIFGKYGTGQHGIVIRRGATFTSFSDVAGTNQLYFGSEYWVRAEYDGTNIVFSFGLDGRAFQEFTTITAATYFTNAPTRVGFGVHHQSSDTVTNKIHCQHFVENGDALPAVLI